MKKMIICGLASTLLLCASCIDSIRFQKPGTLKPSETIAEKELNLEPFSKVDFDVMGHVRIVQSEGNDYRIVLSAPENYLDLYTFKVDKGELEMDMTNNKNNIDTENIEITIYTPQLTRIENNGLCSIVTDSLRCYQLTVENSGVGSVQLNQLMVKRLSVDNSGVGSVTASGTAEWANLDCSGVGHIHAKNLKAHRVKGDVSGVGGIECYVSDTLKASVSGIGSFKYAGNPRVKKLDDSGIGKISEL